MSDKENNEGGFTIKDKRSSYLDDEPAPETVEEKKTPDEQIKSDDQNDSPKESAPEAEINFSTLIFSLTSSAFYHLGDVPDPQTGKVQENLPAVSQTIEILNMLKEKTKNNLDDSESKLLENLIYELQLKFLDKTKQ